MSKNQRLFLFFGVLLISLFCFQFCFLPRSLSSVYANSQVKKDGFPIYKNNIEAVTIKASTHVIRGSAINVAAAEGYTGTDNVTVSVETVLKGELEEKMVSLLIDQNVVKKGSDYIFFINRNENTAYSKPMNTALSSYVIKISESQHAQVVSDLAKDKYYDVFAQPQFNNLSCVESYIKEIKDRPGSRKALKILKKAESFDQLYSMSKYVAFVELDDVEYFKFGDENSTANARYKVLSQFKGKFPESAVTIMLPFDVVDGGRYLLFLDETENSSIVPTAKEGSVLGEGTPEFEKGISFLKYCCK